MFAMFAVVALEAMLNFSVPLYIQIVQGSTPMATAIAMMPFNLSVFFSAMLIVRFYKRLTPRKIGRYGFITCTIALLWLAFVVRNNWSEFAVLIGLVIFGLAQGRWLPCCSTCWSVHHLKHWQAMWVHCAAPPTTR